MELSKAIIGSIVIIALCTFCQSKIKEVGDEAPHVQSRIGSQDTIRSSDFTQVNVFTGGIEGPAIDSKGNLFIVNFSKQGTIGKIDKEGNGEVYLTLPHGSIGNSIQFDSLDNMYVADYVGHNIYKISPAKVIDTLVHHVGFNQPNDITLSSNGIIYASDPKWIDNTGQLWMVKDGYPSLQEKGMGTTNGILVNMDQRKLYVNESVQRNIWVYDIEETGDLSNKKLFHKFDDFGMDGMKFDARGNLHIARYGAGVIAVLSPTGALVNEYYLQGKKPTNLVFGKDGKVIYVTMQERKCVEKITLR